MERPLTAGHTVAKLAVVVAFFGISLLVPAGTWRWPAAWAFAGLYLSFAIPVGVWLFRSNPALLAQRIDWTRRAPRAWDRALLAGLVPAFVAQYVVAGLDYRFGWSHVPPALRAAAFALVAGFYVLLFVLLRENAFLSRVVDVNPQAGHRVVTTGPYAWVRHPM